MAIQQIKIRARITIGSLNVQTPYVLSFNVNKSRGQISTFNATLKVNHSSINSVTTGSHISIEAGTENNLTTIFTGIVRKATINPCHDDPSFVLLALGGNDVLSKLQGKKFTRRCRATKSTWVSINDVTRRGLKSGKFKYRNESSLLIEADTFTLDSGKTTTKDLPVKTAPEKTNKKLNTIIKVDYLTNEFTNIP